MVLRAVFDVQLLPCLEFEKKNYLLMAFVRKSENRRISFRMKIILKTYGYKLYELGLMTSFGMKDCSAKMRYKRQSNTVIARQTSS